MLLGKFKRKKHIFIYTHTYLPGDPGALLVTKSISWYYIHKNHHINFCQHDQVQVFFQTSKIPVGFNGRDAVTHEIRRNPCPNPPSGYLFEIRQWHPWQTGLKKLRDLTRYIANKKKSSHEPFLAWSWNTRRQIFGDFFCLDWRCSRFCRFFGGQSAE